MKLAEYAPELSYGAVAHDPVSMTIFGGTQAGRVSHTSNQDASAFCLSSNAAIVVVADGCAGKPPTFWGRTSCNDVGAKLISALTCRFLRTRIERETGLNGLATEVQAFLLERLEAIRQVIDYDQSQPDLHLAYLTSTLLFAVVTEDRYCICGCGDGYVSVNGNTRELEEQSGTYLSLLLEDRSSHAGMIEHTAGQTSELEMIVLGTDGFAEFSSKHSQLIKHFFADPKLAHVGHYSGANLAAFNDLVWRDASVQEWVQDRDSSDDATFMCIRMPLPPAKLPELNQSVEKPASSKMRRRITTMGSNLGESPKRRGKSS